MVTQACPVCAPPSEDAPAMWGGYESAEKFYASSLWLSIVRVSLEDHYQSLITARKIGDAETIRFYQGQIAACEKALGVNSNAQLSLL